MIAFFKQMLKSQRWEDRFGALNGILAMIQTKGDAGNQDPDAEYETFMWTYLIEQSFPELLLDEEFRVRNQTGLMIKSIILSDRNNKGIAHFDTVKNIILNNIL